MMRPISREYDEREHEKPWDFLSMMWSASQTSNPVTFGDGKKKDKDGHITIHWNKKMMFSGQYANFEGGVEAFIISERMSLTFTCYFCH